jgi:hypothetical protein
MRVHAQTISDGGVSNMLHAKGWKHPSAPQGIGCIWFFLSQDCLTKILVDVLLAHELATIG